MLQKERDLRVTGGNGRELVEKEPLAERKRGMRLYRIFAEFFIGFMCALAATSIYVLVEKFM